MRINITPHHLRSVMAVAQTGSFTAAASKMGLSQPALSRIVRSVEAELGCVIFDRDTRNVSPTAAGETILATMRNALTDYDRALIHLREQALGQSGNVRVATLPSLAQALLAPAIAKMRIAAPSIELHIYDGLSETVMTQVIDGEVDIGLVDRPANHPKLKYVELLKDQVGVVCRNDDPIAALKRVDWQVFDDRPFIAMAVGSSVRTLIDAALSQCHLSVRPLYEPAFLATVGALVSSRAGITALPKLAAAGLQQEGLSWRPLGNPEILRSCGYILRLDRETQPAATTLLTLLEETSTDITVAE
ncbi:LysR family transcriptional regulator [Sphingobium boeckii]|uniref:DNA-binding transcriptional LysR family regulator n=1 Tax=Sphingobium boeckii TaxID=1082345 RepID=A0A7W9ECZ4_9SPHN|nr:LysR family transcriptional regulator [Sphingobium boeckii]MBB5684753.1 DNA-binding transcriptional LysR family regulator [Sphingobium boeckii]